MVYKSIQSIVKKFRFWILATLFWAVLVQISFFFIQNSQAKSLMGAIHGQLRNDLDISNFQFISRNLMDLETLGTIKCIEFKLEGSLPKSILSTTFRGRCHSQSILLNGAAIQSQLKALNGDVFSLSFISLNNTAFIFSLWFIRVVGILLITSFYLYQKEKSEKERTLFELELKHSKMLIEVASQTSHDIRSPLSALTMLVSTLDEISEDKRILIRNATQRINDIANDLLQKGKPISHTNLLSSDHDNDKNIADRAEPIEKSIELIPSLIDVIVSEKRIQYRDNSGLEIETDLNDSFGAFAQINSNELKRALSNLINNSVESFNNYQGQVQVGVKKTTLDQIEIVIKDNGKGIPPQILAKLGQRGVSFGKDGIQSGSGLGVFHAKKTIESFGGIFQIESTKGNGTLIRMTLPLADTPNWFANVIDLTDKKYLITLDDDISIHQIWTDRLKSASYKSIEHLRFQSGDAFVQFVNSNISKLRETLFLVDYELLNQNRTGLDLIETLGIEKYSILITSHYDETSIRSRAADLHLVILPKALSGFVPLKMAKPKV